MTYDVVVVGSGPGGTSVASWLARLGLSTLIVSKAASPRDTVRSDGLMPQAVYWLDRLGCADEVLAATRGCIKACELYVDGEHLLTGRFPSCTIYPDFAVLIVRRRFDELMLENAVRRGARFEGGTVVRGLEYEHDGVRVFAERGRKTVSYKARMVIGADGTSSIISRAIGNTLKDGVLGMSVRTTYRGVKSNGAGMKVYFNREYFPSYGWVFVDDHGAACVGIGCAVDKNFPMGDNMSAGLRRFIESDLEELLASAERIGPYSGAISGFYRPNAIVADRVVLIGDAANQADPLNRGGIHTAMESAWCAAETCAEAFEAGDFSREKLGRYERLWSSRFEPDWRMSEIFMSIVKNPNLKEFSLFALKQVGRLTAADPRFRDFATGVFSGALSQSAWLSPRALYDAFPKDPSAWMSLLRANSPRGAAAGTLRLAFGAAASVAKAGWGLAHSPATTLDWGMDVATKTIRHAERRIAMPSHTDQFHVARA
jgi:geranylgeranyl reductase family protein